MTQLPYPPTPFGHSPGAGPAGPPSGRSTGRLVGGIVLLVIGALLALIAIAATVEAIDGSDRTDVDGLPFVWLFAIVPLLIGWLLLRRRRVPAGPAPAYPVDPMYPPHPQAYAAAGSWTPLPATPTWTTPGPTSTVGGPIAAHRNPGRLILGVLLVIVGAALLVTAVGLTVAVFTGATSGDDIRGLGFVYGIAVVLLRFGAIQLRRPPAPHTHSSAPAGGPPGGPFAGPTGPPPAADLPGAGRHVDRSVRYLQLACQVSPLPVLVAVALMAVGIWVLTLVSSGPGPRGFLVFLPVLPGLYLFAVLLYLPYRIRLRDGVLTMGAAGVPRIGRVWRQLSVDLADVTSWELRPAKHDRTRTGNNLRGPGGRWLLIVHTDASAVRGRAMPDHVMVGYAVLSAASVGYVAGGPIEIRARREAPLRAALERALPSR